MSDNEQQLALITGDSDEAMFLPREEMAKRYTATTVEKIEARRNGIVALLGCGLSVEFVAKTMMCSTRTVNALGSKYSALAAASTNEMCKVLGSLAMEAAYQIKQKMATAKPGELGVIMGIALQRKQEMELGGAGALDDKAIDVEQESPALAKARKFLEARGMGHGAQGETAENAKVTEV